MTTKPKAVEFDAWAVCRGGRFWADQDGHPLIVHHHMYLVEGDSLVRVRVTVQPIEGE